ncbi:AAA family ATPase [Novipirellula sp. SH528]|uniref:AAA family ATPase n=1 Tax=Novipirellula sp. SH528 TaxID=3454466 RepID=UPI003F9FFAE5
MSPEDEAIRGLREALKVSPDNLPLRVHLAQTLSTYGRFDEAATEYRNALSLSPENADVKFGLASAYLSQDEQSKAMVILEDLCRSQTAPAKAFVVLAKLLLGEGKVRDAVIQYKEALERDPTSADPILGDQLGVGEKYQDGDVVEGRSRESTQPEAEDFVSEIERPKIKFEDVGGMEKLKDEIRLKILYPLQHPEMYEAYGKKIGGGILMYGPPGCGKTYLARATAGELGAGFISVGISDVLDMWTGQSERNLAQIFEQARYNKPCVLFFDEVDALGGRRSDMSSGAGRHVINQFLSEMDGVDKSNEGVLVLAATNAPWHVDPAFRRPGRFDRVLFVPPPDTDARASVLRIHLKGKPQDAIDFAQVAKKTAEFSGADMKAVVDQAIEEKLRIALKEGIPKPLVTKDLIGSAKTLRPTTREWFSTARNYAIYSNQGGIYDDVLKYLNL